jgi:hypothetical protein
VSRDRAASNRYPNEFGIGQNTDTEPPTAWRDVVTMVCCDKLPRLSKRNRGEV